ncbi:hypothetical protein GCM10010195_66120 [Kitasatospora griseola]|nr:hypothetical protein GCM10010195_66120 [Kitasatospora griseola]
MEILEAYDLTGSYRKAAELAGCDHHTVRRYVQLRGQGVDPTERAVRSKLIDGFLPKVEELVERSRSRVGADAVHKKIVAMGFTGTDRTTRRAVAAAKESYRAGNRRVFRPAQQIDGWTTAYKANMYEVEDLLDYVSRPANPLNELLRGRPVTTRLAQVAPHISDGPVALTHPGKKPTTINVSRDGDQIAAVPAARHHAVLTMLDSGLDLTHCLEAGQLVTTLATADL